MIARRMFGTVRYGRTGAVVLVTSSPLLPNKVKTGSANSQVPAQGRGGHVAAIPPGTGSMVRANDPNRAGSGKREVGSGNSSKAGDLQGALLHTP